MALKVWIPLISNYNNQGTEIVNPVNVGASTSTAGPLGASYYFNGTSNQITASYTCAESEFTVCLWVTFTKLNIHLIDMRNQDGTGYQPAYVNSSSGVQVGGSNSSYPYIGFVPTLNTWYHLAIVYSASKVQLYVNGEFYGETTSAKATNFNKKIDIHIGSRYSGSNWFGGNISDFRLYNQALSAYEVKDIAKGLLVHYTRPTNAITVGNQVIDSSGFGRNGTVYTANLTYDMSSFTARYFFRYNTGSSGSYISRTSPSSHCKTICFWLSTPKTASTVFFADYKSKLAFGFNSSGYVIASCDSFSTKMFAGTAITANTPVHIVIRKTSSDVDLFVNGVQITTRYSNNYWTHSSDTLMIGQRSTGSPMGNAKFSDFRMYVMRLSDAEILDLYQTSLKQFNNGKSSPFELKEDTVGKVQVGKNGLLTNNSFTESTNGNKFKATQVLSNEFIER